MNANEVDMHKQRTREQIIAQERAKRIQECYKGQLILSLAILVDVFDFTPDEVVKYMEKFEILSESYLNNKEDLKDMVKNLNEYCGKEII